MGRLLFFYFITYRNFQAAMINIFTLTIHQITTCIVKKSPILPSGVGRDHKQR